MKKHQFAERVVVLFLINNVSQPSFITAAQRTTDDNQYVHVRFMTHEGGLIFNRHYKIPQPVNIDSDEFGYQYNYYKADLSKALSLTATRLNEIRDAENTTQ